MHGKRAHSGWRAGLRAGVAVLCGALLPGCGAGYLLQAARGHTELMSSRVPLDDAIERHASLRAQLTQIRAARDFASRELGLPDNASYRSWADIGRPFVVWSVVAVPEFSVQPREWCFPVAGCVSYRGYFDERAARAFAARLAREGYDVSVGGVAAYSTLGRFADPIVSSMLRGTTEDAISTLFHELAHQVVYVPGDTAFNEAFAVTVEQAGLARWLERRDAAPDAGDAPDSTLLEARRAHLEVQQRFVAAVVRARADLAALYARPLAPAPMRIAKQQRLLRLGDELRALEAAAGRRAGFSRWIELGLNNAQLASVATYWQCVAGFERELAGVDGDLRRIFQRVRDLARRPEAERRTLLCAAGPR
ncbi:MAG: aminopeptidase [Steroidobacteraceae bacterium]